MLYQFDQVVFHAVNVDLRSPLLGVVFMGLSYLGLGGTQAALSLALLTLRQTRHMVLPLLLTIIVSGLPVAQLLKQIIYRDRPSQLYYAVAEERWKYDSFPSGHTATSFGCAMMLWLLTRGTRSAWVGPVAMVLALGVGISRIYRGVHWPTDVLGGACGGVFAACLVYLLLERGKVKLTPPDSAA